MTDIKISETHHGPADARRYAYDPLSWYAASKNCTWNSRPFPNHSTPR
jgi:hypothetical protein